MEQAELRAAVQGLPREAGIELADGNWKVVRAFVAKRFGEQLCRSSCLNYLHRRGFVLKRPTKRLLKADAATREAWVRVDAALRVEAQGRGEKIFFVDEGLFHADADPQGKEVLTGEPALVNSTSPARSEKACYYSAVCVETGEVETMDVEDPCTAETSAAFWRQFREKHSAPLLVIWDNGPTH